MKTAIEVKASKMLRDDVCLNCTYSKTGFRRKQPVLKCSLTDRVVNPQMIGCPLWRRQYGAR